MSYTVRYMNLLSLVLAVTTVADSQPKKPDYSPPAGAPYIAVNVTVPTDRGYTLAGTLTLPKGASRAHPVPAIVTLTGSGPQDRDEMSVTLPSYRPFRQLADSLGRRGIAVLRMDDRGVGASGGKFKGTTDEGFRDDVRSGLAFLRTRPEIDTTRLGLVGHSEGPWIALPARHPRVSVVERDQAQRQAQRDAKRLGAGETPGQDRLDRGQRPLVVVHLEPRFHGRAEAARETRGADPDRR